MLQECFCRGYNENCHWCSGSGRRSVQLAIPVYPGPARGEKQPAQKRCGFCGKSVADLAAHIQEQHPRQRPAAWKGTNPVQKPNTARNAPVIAPGAQSTARAAPVQAGATSRQEKRGKKRKGSAPRSIIRAYEAMRERERKAAEARRLERQAQARAMARVVRPVATTAPKNAPAGSPAPARTKPANTISFKGLLACPECSGQVADLRAHLVAEHGWRRNATTGRVAPSADPKRTVPCPCCRGTLIRRDRLDRHLARQHETGDGKRAGRPSRARTAARGQSATLMIHNSTPVNAKSPKPAAVGSAGQKKTKRNPGAKAGPESGRGASSGERTRDRAPSSREPGNFYEQERHERLSDATRGLGYARREGGRWGSTVAYDDYGDESHA